MHLLQDVNPLIPSGADMMPVLLIAGIWAAVGIAFFVWYLWSLSKLFPLLGIKGTWGWIPVWNQWQLIQRGGLPGWLVLLVLIPGLGALVVLVVTIVAMHRINTEFGKGGGMTALGVFLAPLWAMLLANHITDGRYGAAAGWAPARDEAGSDADGGAGSGAGALQGLPYANLAPQQSAHGYAPQPAAAAVGAFAGEEFAQLGFEQPVAEQQGFEQHGFAQQGSDQQEFAQQGFAQQNFEQQSFDPNASAQSQRSVFAPPVNGEAQSGDAHYGNAQQSYQGQQSQQGQAALYEQQAQSAPAVQQPTVQQPAVQQPTSPADQVVPNPAGQPQNNWGFSNTTEGAYERLAAEGTQASVSAPLGGQVPQQPFSWPAPQAEDAAPTIFDVAEAQNPAPAAQAPLGMNTRAPLPAAAEHAAGASVAPQPFTPQPKTPQPVASQPMTDQAVAQQTQAAAQQPIAQQPIAPQPPVVPQTEAVAQGTFDDSASFSRTGPSSTAPMSRAMVNGEAVDPAVPAAAGIPAVQPGALAAGGLAVAAGIVAAPVTPVAPVAPVAASSDPHHAAAAAADDFEDDHTIVVRRETRWGLELPSGEVLELLGHDVVVGRRPEPAGAYEVLKISDPTRTLSKSHVRMRRTGEAWTIEDLHSTNGVALIDETGATVALDAGHERGTTERMLIGTLEVKLVRVS